jgi:hypothetical protein
MANEIIISTNDNDFMSMVIKLMGRGMRMSMSMEGQFVLTLDEISDLVTKISQRVLLQNHCKMTDFHAEFSLSDGSKETVPSFDQLNIYRSINPNICNSCKMSFAFLIDFHSRGVEKQSVDIEIRTKDKGTAEKNDPLEGGFTFGIANINIEYTDVTWANDIKNLFEKYLDVHLQRYPIRSKIAEFLNIKNSTILVFPMFLIGLTLGTLGDDPKTKQQMISEKIGELSSSESLSAIHQKLDILIFKQNDIRSGWDLLFVVVLFISILSALAILSLIIRNIPKSAILLSPESQKVYDRKEGKRGRLNLYGIGGIILSVITSVVAANIDRLIVTFF